MHLAPPVALVLHGSGDLAEASNVGASDEGGELALRGGNILLGGVETVLESILHDALELLVNLLGSPVEALRVLSHLETGDGDTTSVGSLSGTVPDGLVLVLAAVSLEDLDGLLSAAHVGALSDELASGSDQCLGLLAGNLVLSRRGEGNVDLANLLPGTGTLDVLETVVLKSGKGLALELELGDGLDVLGVEAGLVGSNEGTLAVGERDDLAAELDNLEGSKLGDVSGSRDGDALAGERFLASGGILDHVLDIVDETVAGGLGANQAATPRSTLAGENALPAVLLGAVCAKQIANLAATNADVAGGDISVGADVLAELPHEGNAELADLFMTTISCTSYRFAESRLTSLSDLPLGSKSEPPLPPPMFTSEYVSTKR